MKEYGNNQVSGSTQSNLSQKSKYNLSCILSLVFGVIAVIIGGAFSNPNYLLCGACCLVSIIGVGLAFVGRINTYNTKTKGNKLALTGLILSLIMMFGSVGYTVFDMLGKPANFGIDSETDKKMIILIGVSCAVAAVCAVVSVVYYKISKKYK